MPLILSVKELRDRLRHDDNEDINAAIQEALEAASETIPSTIRSDLTRVTVEEVFYIQRGLEWAPSVGGYPASRRLPASRAGVQLNQGHTATQAKLLLERGFVATGVAYTAVAAGTYQSLSDANSQVDLRSLNSKDLTLMHHEQGELLVMDFLFHNTYAKVTYTAGLEDDSGNPAVYQSVPEWLKQLAALEATRILNTNPVVATVGSSGTSEARTAVAEQREKTLKGLIDKMVSAHARYRPGWARAQQATATGV